MAVIELMSPGNKSSRRDWNRFVDKAIAVLDRGIHLVVIDPFPPSPRDPNGAHAAIRKGVTGRRYRQPENQSLAASSYLASETMKCFVRPFNATEAVPEIPLFLTETRHVSIPLESCYEAAWAEFPKEWKPRLL